MLGPGDAWLRDTGLNSLKPAEKNYGVIVSLSSIPLPGELRFHLYQTRGNSRGFAGHASHRQSAAVA